MRFIFLLLSPFIVIILFFIFLPRPHFPESKIVSYGQESALKPTDGQMETKIRDMKKAQNILDKIDSDTIASNKRLAEFYARFHISPTPYEVIDNKEQITDNIQQNVLSASVEPTTYNLQPTSDGRKSHQNYLRYCAFGRLHDGYIKSIPEHF